MRDTNRQMANTTGFFVHCAKHIHTHVCVMSERSSQVQTEATQSRSACVFLVVQSSSGVAGKAAVALCPVLFSQASPVQVEENMSETSGCTLQARCERGFLLTSPLDSNATASKRPHFRSTVLNFCPHFFPNRRHDHIYGFIAIKGGY